MTRSFELPATPSGIRQLRLAVDRIAAEAGMGARSQDIQIAISEACGNVVVHAYPRGEGSMELVAVLDDQALRIVVTDHGTGFTPGVRSRTSPGLGFGLPIIEQLADHVALRTAPAAGTTLTMRFDR